MRAEIADALAGIALLLRATVTEPHLLGVFQGNFIHSTRFHQDAHHEKVGA